MILLAVIYLVFIGVGLPDSLLGTAWPFIREEFGFFVDGAGTLSILISLGIIAASLSCYRIVKKGGFRLCAGIGLGCLIVALTGYTVARYFWQMAALCLVMGFGSGTLQTLFNDLVARKYTKKHMNWLQGAWGIGAVLGPMMLSYSAGKEIGWRGGYATVAAIEAVILIAFLIATAHRQKELQPQEEETEKTPEAKSGKKERIRLKGKALLIGQYFLYCSMENSIMLWGASYLIAAKGMEATKAAQVVSVFFIGLTIGRLLSGFLPEKIRCTQIIGASSVAAAILDILLLCSGDMRVIPVIFFLLGCAMAPEYPLLLKVTPELFPEDNPQMIMGIQVASAYLGILFIPALLGKVFAGITFAILPVVEAACLLGVWGCVTFLHRRAEKTYGEK